MNFNWSKALTVLGAVAAAVGAVAPLVKELDPHTGAILVILGVALTAFNDKLHQSDK